MLRAIQSGLAMALFVLSTAIAYADNTPPSVPGSISIESVSSSTIKLNWSPSWDDQSVLGYNIYRDGNYISTVPENNFLDTGLTGDQSYHYWIVAFDQAGNFSPTSNWVFGRTKAASYDKSLAVQDTSTGSTYSPDQPPPPTHLNAWIQDDGSVKLTWSRPQWHTTIKGYNIYRNGVYVHTLDGAEEWVEWGLPLETRQTYDVVAIDVAGRFSVHSDQVTVSVNNAQTLSNHVSAPENLRTLAVNQTGKTLIWDAAKASRSCRFARL